MPAPLAAHTFDFLRVYLSSRDNAVPGSGTWSAPVTIFDGTADQSFSEATTFSAGGLSDTDPRGIVVGNAVGAPVFLGDGLPTAPITMNIALPGGASAFNVDYWDVSNGGWKVGGVYYVAILVLPAAGPQELWVVSSPDNGATWTKVTAGVGSPTGDGAFGAMQRVDDMVYFFMDRDLSDTNFGIYPLNLTTGQWEASFAHVDGLNIFDFGLNQWSNDLYKYQNGDFGVIYTGSGGVKYKEWASGTWAAEVPINTGHAANSVIDPSLTLIHQFSYPTNSRLGRVKYSTIAQGGVVTADIFVFPAIVGSSSDGVGHCSIQNGMLFVPRDDFADFDNAVWVATLPATTFLKETLPVPADEVNTLVAVAINSGGHGYVNGETVIVPGTTNPALITIVTQAGGVATVIDLTSGGGGYTAGVGVATASGGPSPGVGSGLTINTTVRAGKTPSCAYMMFPNGYRRTPVIGTCPITIDSPPSGGGSCLNPGTNPMLDSYLELRKVLVAWKKETHLPVRGKS